MNYLNFCPCTVKISCTDTQSFHISWEAYRDKECASPTTSALVLFSSEIGPDVSAFLAKPRGCKCCTWHGFYRGVKGKINPAEPSRDPPPSLPQDFHLPHKAWEHIPSPETAGLPGEGFLQVSLPGSALGQAQTGESSWGILGAKTWAWSVPGAQGAAGAVPGQVLPLCTRENDPSPGAQKHSQRLWI